MDDVVQGLLETPLSRGAGAGPLQGQLHRRIRSAILGARLAPGTRLPGSRLLAASLGVSRNTVTAAYEQLVAEGYVQSDRQGTRVALMQARQASRRRSTVPLPVVPPLAERRLALLGETLSAVRSAPQTGGDATGIVGGSTMFRPGVPSLADVPLAAWRRMLERASRRAGSEWLNYGDPLGEAALRAAIARHLGVARGVSCDPSQVVITEGAQEALLLCVRLLARPGDVAWVEEPGYRGAKAAMHAGDLRVLPVRVDDEGLCVSDAQWREHAPRIVYTTPSHQYPTGAVLSATRRLALIAQARRHGAWLIEDDYDSEFRHAGEPIAAMQGLVPHAPVLYVGTFSKTMFPSLRIGFLVLPEHLLSPIVPALNALLRGGHRLEQRALAEFIDSGQFARHLGRMRRLYRDRQQALRETLARRLDVPHRILGGQCGMHLTLRLAGEFDDRAVVQRAARHGLAPSALSAFAMKPSSQDNGLVLGYGNTPAESFDELTKPLSRWIREARRTDLGDA